MALKGKLKEIGPSLWELAKGAKPGMRVPTWFFLSKRLYAQAEEGAVEQAANVTFLPGIYKHSIALPDMHRGYGFPIGGVAALDAQDGGLSPGGIGFDINCGVRLLRTNLKEGDVRPKLGNLLEEVFRNIPCGVGKRGKIRLSTSQLKNDVLEAGARWAVQNGYGTQRDLEHLEEKGCMETANADKVSDRALQRGAPQLGTLGAGNHFLEIQKVNEIYDERAAKIIGIEEEGQVCVMIHTGSRGFGHQVCTDYLKLLTRRFANLVGRLPDRELVYAPAGTRECGDYYAAMSCGANYAFCNRQMITHWIRQSMKRVLGMSEEEIRAEIVYGLCHNIGKLEEHEVDGGTREVYVHRKGATRCFGPGREDVPQDHREIGQVSLLPGTMGTASYVLLGTERAEEQTFASIAHGSGRAMSRTKARRMYRGEMVKSSLEKKGILSRAASWKIMAEETPEAYHDIDEVVRTCEVAGIARKVVRLSPMGVVKG